MQSPSLYRLEIAPLIVLPLGRSPLFSYASHESIPLGSLVSISFGKQEIRGVVFNCDVLPGKRPLWMKYVSKVISPALLTENQCLFAEKISSEYFTPLGRTLIHSIPEIAKKRKTESLNENITTLRPTREETLVIKKMSIASYDQILFLDSSPFRDPKKLLLLIAKKLSSKGQVLILVPEITILLSYENFLKKHFQNNEYTLLHSLLSPGSFFDAWQKIREGKTKIVVATRQGLFAPYKKLEGIILTEEQDESYKQWDMSPRYHAKKASEILSNIHNAKLLLVSPTPSVDSYYFLKEKKYHLLAPLPKESPLSSDLHIINLRLERYKKNFSPFSLELKQHIENTLSQKGQVLIYINRQGINTFSICENCKNIFRCKNCNSPLSSTKEGYFRCLSCSYKTGLFPNCPSCGNLNFKHRGFGTEKVEREALKLFPHARIARLDGSNVSKLKETRALFEKGYLLNLDILIGTQMILKDPPLPNLSLIAMIDADSLLFFPDFRADERLFSHLKRAKLQLNRTSSSKGIYLQTFHPESALFQKMQNSVQNSFLEKVLSDRESLFYPPFCRLIALTVRAKTEKEIASKASQYSEELKNILPKTFKIHPPSPYQFLKRKHFFESTLLIRSPHSEIQNEKLIAFLHKISKDCIIDVDPIAFR